MVRRGLGAYPEFLVMLAAIAAAGAIVLPKDPLMIEVRPHPFYAVILLMALRYGSPMGIIAGLVCAGVLLVGMAVHGMSVPEAFHVGAPEMAGLLLFVGVGALVGEMVEHHLKRADHLEGRLSEMRERFAASEASRTEMERAYREVESRIAGQTKTLISLSDSVRQLDSLEPREIYPGLVKVLGEQLGVERCGIWLIMGEGSHRRLAPTEDPRAPLPALGEAALRMGRVVTARDYFVDTDGAPQDGILAGPLCAGDARPVAIAVVESMSFVGFTHRAAKQFEVLLDWASRALDKAHRVAAIQRRAVFNPNLDLTSELFLRTRAKADLSLAIRRGSPATVLVCRAEGQIPTEVNRRLVMVFARVFRYQTRLSDAEAYFEDQNSFVLFLPEVGAQGARVVRDRLDRHVAEFEFRPYGNDARLALRWGMAERGNDMDFDAMLQRALSDTERAAS